MKKIRKSRFFEKIFYSTKRRKILLAFSVIFLFTFISIAYAILQNNLSVKGGFSLRLVGIRIVDVKVSGSSAASNLSTSHTTDTISIGGSFTNDAAYIGYTVTIKNSTTKPAIVTDIVIQSSTGVSISYSFGSSSFGFGTEIPAGGSVEVSLRIVPTNYNTSASGAQNFTDVLKFSFVESYVNASPPVITYDPSTSSSVYGRDVNVTLTATDDTAIKSLKYCTSTLKSVSSSYSCTPSIDVGVTGTGKTVSKSITLSSSSSNAYINFICATATDNAPSSRSTTKCSTLFTIDKQKPTWQYVSSTTTHTVNNYAMKNSTVKITFKATDDQYVEIKKGFSATDITVLVAGNTVTPTTKTLTNDGNNQYTLTISGVSTTGLLGIRIAAGTVKDKVNSSDLVTINSGITYVVSKLRANAGDQTFNSLTYGKKIVSIHFVTSLSVPSNATAHWDVSENSSGSVMAWIIPSSAGSGSGSGLLGYALYIGGDGVVYAPPDCNSLFAGMTQLSDISFDNFDFLYTTKLDSMFSYCSSLTNVTISSVSGNSILTSASSMFEMCSKLRSVTFSKNFTWTSLSDMSRMFINCNSLTSVKFEQSSNIASAIRNIQYLFYNCLSLTTVSMSNFRFDSVTSYSSAFYGMPSSAKVDLYSFSSWQTKLKKGTDYPNSWTSSNII